MSSAPKFDQNKAFFILDSDSLEQIQTAFYGFTILDSAIVRTARELENRLPEGDGAYILIRREAETVTVYQDFMGSYGLYLFQEAGYFALSNSFALLVDHVKRRYPLTLNREYADFFLAADLCSVAYGETMVNEIRVLDRCAEVEIRIPDRQLTIRHRDYLENTVELSSREGMELLDRWFHKWAGLIRSLKTQTNNMQSDLSGGFDSRLVFSLLLGSGVNLSDIFMFSIKDDLHTHSEDFAIASAMAEHYGFRLNNSGALTPGLPLDTPEDILNLSLYTKQSFHKQIYPQSRYYDLPRYNFVGNGGECIRDYWNMSAEEYIENAVKRVKPFPKEAAPRMEASIRKVLNRAFSAIQEKFTAFGRPLEAEDLTLNLYRETRCRNHFGKSIVERYLANSITCAPLLDPLLHRLKRTDRQCRDNNLLAAVIYSRFDRYLLSFKFDNGRRIEPKTILCARALNQQYPFRSRLSRDPIPTPREQIPERLKAVPANTLTEMVMNAFSSLDTKVQICRLFSEDTYDFLRRDVENRKFYPLQNAYAAISIAWIARETAVSQNLVRHTLSFGFPPDEGEDSLYGHPGLKNWITARLDVKVQTGTVEVLEISDNKALVHTPGWFSQPGQGYVVESQKGTLTLKLRCSDGGPLSIALRGRAVQDRDGQRIPFWVDYTRVLLNGTERIREITPVCHDVPLKFSEQTEAGGIHSITLRWEPHDETRSRLLQRITPKT